MALPGIIMVSEIPAGGLAFRLAERRAALAELFQYRDGDANLPGDRFEAELLVERKGDTVRVTGACSFDYASVCSRCLAEVPATASVPVDLTYLPVERMTAAGEDGLDLQESDLRFGYYRNDRFDLSHALSEVIVLGLPAYPVCRPECRGLCPGCGRDLNAGPCDCPVSGPDPRWDGLRRVLKKS